MATYKNLDDIFADDFFKENIVLEKKSNDNEVPVEVTDVVNESKVEEPKVEVSAEQSTEN